MKKKTNETAEKRSAIMRAVKGRDTTPEITVRRLVRSIASGYRLHRPDVPGKPDIAYLSRKIAIFVHGCFWHGHRCKRGARMPKTNVSYWSAKIARNRARDRRVRRQLKKHGWRTLIMWECEIKNKAAVLHRLRTFLNP
jgi:DNA mismatch endonuclease, patch repair protein